MTNGEYIRSLSDDKLAIWICRIKWGQESPGRFCAIRRFLRKGKKNEADKSR